MNAVRVPRGAQRIAHQVVDPFARAGGYYALTWARWLRRESPGDLPPIAPHPMLGVQATIDEVVVAMARLGHRPRSEQDWARIDAEARLALEQWDERGWLVDPTGYHPAPNPPEDIRWRERHAGRLGYRHLTFESGYEPAVGEPGRERWLAPPSNRIAHVWVLRHQDPRPWLVHLHGAAMGQARVDLHTFKAARLHQELGLNVAFLVLPRHGPRREGLPFGVGFPDDDLLDNVHALAQTMWDTRRLIAWIRSHTDQPIGLHGLSLGGYCAALLAGLDPDLACVIAGVPPVDFADLFERHAPRQYRHSPEWTRLVPLSRAVHRVVSPLAIEPVVPLDRRFIYAGLADRIVHPQRQVQELWRHWGEPSIEWFKGGHVGFFFSDPVQTFLTDALRSAGLVARAGEEPNPSRHPHP
jgi:hypothetical protein